MYGPIYFAFCLLRGTKVHFYQIIKAEDIRTYWTLCTA